MLLKICFLKISWMPPSISFHWCTKFSKISYFFSVSDLNLKDDDGNNEIEGVLDKNKMKNLKLIAYHMSTWNCNKDGHFQIANIFRKNQYIVNIALLGFCNHSTSFLFPFQIVLNFLTAIKKNGDYLFQCWIPLHCSQNLEKSRWQINHHVETNQQEYHGQMWQFFCPKGQKSKNYPPQDSCHDCGCHQGS